MLIFDYLVSSSFCSEKWACLCICRRDGIFSLWQDYQLYWIHAHLVCWSMVCTTPSWPLWTHLDRWFHALSTIEMEEHLLVAQPHSLSSLSSQLIHTSQYLTMVEHSNNCNGDPEMTWHWGKVGWKLCINNTLGEYAVTSAGWGLISHWDVDMSVKLLWVSFNWIPLHSFRELCELTVPVIGPVYHWPNTIACVPLQD